MKRDFRLGASGLWAPGVRLMRQVRFAPKMVLLITVLVCAIGVPATFFFRVSADEIAFSTKEREGVRYLRALYPVLLATLNVRSDTVAQSAGNASAAASESQAQWQAALQYLQREELTLSAALGVPPSGVALQKFFRSDHNQPGRPGVTFESLGAIPRKLIHTIADICDHSNLTLDPEVHTFYIMDALCFRLPEVIERTGAIRDIGAVAVFSRELKPYLREQLAVNMAVVSFQIEAIENGFIKTVAIRPEVSNRIALDRAKEATRNLIDLTRAHVLDAPTLESAWVTSIRAGGDAALHVQRELVDGLLPLLDDLLAERVAAKQRTMAIIGAVIGFLFFLAAYLAVCHIRLQLYVIALLRQHIGALARRDLRPIPPVIAGADELVSMTSDVRALHEQISRQLWVIRQAAERLVRESDQMVTHACYAGPDLVKVNAQMLRDIAQRLQQETGRFAL